MKATRATRSFWGPIGGAAERTVDLCIRAVDRSIDGFDACGRGFDAGLARTTMIWRWAANPISGPGAATLRGRRFLSRVARGALAGIVSIAAAALSIAAACAVLVVGALVVIAVGGGVAVTAATAVVLSPAVVVTAFVESTCFATRCIRRHESVDTRSGASVTI